MPVPFLSRDTFSSNIENIHLKRIHQDEKTFGFCKKIFLQHMCLIKDEEKDEMPSKAHKSTQISDRVRHHKGQIKAKALY